MVALMGGGVACAAPGCTVTTTNQSEFGVRYGTEITFFSRAAQTSPQGGNVTITLDERLMPDGKTKAKTNIAEVGD